MKKLLLVSMLLISAVSFSMDRNNDGQENNKTFYYEQDIAKPMEDNVERISRKPVNDFDFFEFQYKDSNGRD